MECTGRGLVVAKSMKLSNIPGFALDNSQQYLTSKTCEIASLKFICHDFNSSFFNFFSGSLNYDHSISILQFNNCILQENQVNLIGEAIKTGCNSLKTLNFVNVPLSSQNLEKIVDAVLYQNTFEPLKGIVSLSMEGCGLDSGCSKQLGRLIGKTDRLRNINLNRNFLGGHKFRGSSLVKIAKALVSNSSLEFLILSSNKLSLLDWQIIYDVIQLGVKYYPKNEKIIVNATDNNLHEQVPHPRLITFGSSPRLLGVPLECDFQPALESEQKFVITLPSRIAKKFEQNSFPASK